MPKITLLGSNSGRNAGDAAILASIMASLTQELGPDVEFEVPTTHPDFVKDNYGEQFRVKAISVMPWTGSVRLLGLPTLRSIARTDATMITDGIIFDVKLFNPLFNFLITLVFLVPWAKLWGKKVVCFNVGIGPLESFWGRTFARWVGNASDLIMVRDEDSLKLFREIGVAKEIHLTADAVFTNWAAPAERTKEILNAHKLGEAATAGELLAVNVTRYVDMWLKKSEKLEPQTSFVSIFASVLAQFKASTGAEPFFFITQVMDVKFAEDLKEMAAKKYQELCGESWEPALLSNVDYSNHELMAVAAKCRLLVGMRLHSLIIAAQAGTPVAGLVYAPKVRSFLKQLGTPKFSFELAESTEKSLLEGLGKAWTETDSMKTVQQKIASDLRLRAARAAEMVREHCFPGKSRSGADAARAQAAS